MITSSPNNRVLTIMNSVRQHSSVLRYDTIDDLQWKTDRQAASLIWHMN